MYWWSAWSLQGGGRRPLPPRRRSWWSWWWAVRLDHDHDVYGQHRENLDILQVVDDLMISMVFARWKTTTRATRGSWWWWWSWWSWLRLYQLFDILSRWRTTGHATKMGIMMITMMSCALRSWSWCLWPMTRNSWHSWSGWRSYGLCKVEDDDPCHQRILMMVMMVMKWSLRPWLRLYLWPAF